MTFIRNAANTGEAESGRIVRDRLPDLARLESNKKVLTLLLSHAEDDIRNVDAPSFGHWEHEPMARTVQINNGAGYTTTDTAFTVDSNEGVYINGLYRVMRTGEHVLVSSTTSTTGITVTRARAGTSRAALVDNDVLLSLSTARAEGSSVGGMLHQGYTERTGYVQKFEIPFGVTDIADLTKFETGNEYNNRKKEAMFEFGVRAENAMWWGEANVDNSTSATPTYYTRGFFNIPNINEFTVGGTLTEDEFNSDILPTATRYTQGDRLLGIGGAAWVGTFAKWGRDRLQTNPGLSKVLGFQVMTYHSPYGVSIDIIYHKLFEGSYGDISDNWARMAALVDPANLRLARMQATRIKESMQNNDEDLRIGAVKGIFGLDYRLAKTHSVLRDIRV